MHDAVPENSCILRNTYSHTRDCARVLAKPLGNFGRPPPVFPSYPLDYLGSPGRLRYCRSAFSFVPTLPVLLLASLGAVLGTEPGLRLLASNAGEQVVIQLLALRAPAFHHTPVVKQAHETEYRDVCNLATFQVPCKLSVCRANNE